jgi:hypothetical protein
MAWGSRSFDLHDEAEILQAAEQAFGRLLFVTFGEVAAAKIAVRDAVSEHEIDGGEHRGGNRDNRLLRSAPALEPDEWGA